MVINREKKGLDVGYVSNLREANKVTRHLVAGREQLYDGQIENEKNLTYYIIADAAKVISYLPRLIMYGYENAYQKERERNGATTFEYQLLGSLTAQQCHDLIRPVS